jgi:hypothetical protein
MTFFYADLIIVSSILLQILYEANPLHAAETAERLEKRFEDKQVSRD